MSIQLIEAIYNNGTLRDNCGIHYEQTLKEIEYFEVSSQIYHLLKQNNSLKNTPDFFHSKLNEKYKENLFFNIFLHHHTSQILQAFEQYKIEVIPLKGTIFAEKYFGHIGARPTSDIDLLVHHEDLESAIKCIEDLGFTYRPENFINHFHCCFSRKLSNSKIPLMVELHWNILKENTAQLKIEEFWEKATPYHYYKYVKELSAYHTFYFACLHGWRHNLDSLKYFIDILQIIKSHPLDFDLLWEDASNHKTLKRVMRTLSIVYKQFPFLNDVIKLPQTRKYLYWDYEVFLDAKKKKMKHYIDFIDYQVFSYDKWRHCLSAFSDWVQLQNK
ncbi:MAG: nucleotidyltransferase domain-containing protein [Heyndrickxia sp.]